MDCTVKNANFERVLMVLEQYLRERYQHVCTCGRCFNDIAALALNYLPPHYYVDAEDSRNLGSPWVMVEAAVSEAIERVLEYPNHSPRASGSQGEQAAAFQY